MLPDLQTTIIFEDEQYLLINKPAGISVTPGPGNPFEQTVAGWLHEYVGEAILEVGQENRWGIVHRLDKDTSGVLVLPKTSTMFEHLVGQFRERKVDKIYQTLVWGNVSDTIRVRKDASNTQTFIINAPIARHPKGFSRFIVSEEGKPAVTQCTVKAHYAFNNSPEKLSLTLLNVLPQTGRTHQIRVHLKALRHPVVGDKQYQTRAQLTYSEQLVQRQFLHASSLSFTSLTGDYVSYEAPLSKDLSQCLELLEAIEIS